MATKDVTDRMVCEAVAQWEAERDAVWSYDILKARTGQCFKVCYAALERAAERDLIEYGVSLRTAWLTDKGKALLK